MKERKFPADWKEYGRRAGPIRNREMMQAAAYECVQGAIVLVLALPSHKGTSKGTLGAIKEAFEAKLEVVTAWVG